VSRGAPAGWLGPVPAALSTPNIYGSSGGRSPCGTPGCNQVACPQLLIRGRNQGVPGLFKLLEPSVTGFVGPMKARTEASRRPCSDRGETDAGLPRAEGRRRDRRARQRRWRNAVRELVRHPGRLLGVARQPSRGLNDSTLAEQLRHVCELDLSPLDAALPPKGFGRDRSSATSIAPGPASDAWAYPSGTYAWAGLATPTTATKAASIVKVGKLLRSIDVALFWCQWMLGHGQSAR
jgi:hypothetical protein